MKRGIVYLGGSHIRAPDINPPPFQPDRRVKAGALDWFWPLRRAVNHRIYWDDEDARAPTCFIDLVDETGWQDHVC